MPGNQSQFIVDFRAEVKNLKKAIGDLKSYQKQAQREAKTVQNAEKKFERDRQRTATVHRKQQEKDRKADKAHIIQMTKLQGQQHKQSLQQIAQLNRENQKLIQQNKRMERQQGGGQAGRPGFLRRTAGALGAAVGGAGLLGLGFLISSARSGYERYLEYGRALGQTAGLAPGRQIRQGIRGAMGSRLGFSMTDTAAMVPAMARATGEVGPREMQQAQRSTGMETGEVADIFGTLRRAGFTFTGAGRGRQSAGGNEFKKLLAAGTASGLEKARFPEFAQGVKQIVDQQRGLFTGVVNVGDIAKQLAAWGRTGRPGMQGAAGANLFQQVTNAIRQPGGGEFGESFMLQAMGFGKPGGRTDFYAAEKRRESAGRDPGVVMDVMKEFRAQFGRGEEAALAMREALGVSLEQAETLMQIYDSTEDAKAKQDQIAQIMKEAAPLEKQSLEAMKDVGHTVQRIATLTDRGIGIGAKVAPLIEKLEDWQYEALQFLMQIAQDVRSITTFIKDKFGDSDKEAQRATTSLAKKFAEPLSLDPMERRKQIAERRRLEQQASTAMGEESAFGTAVRAVKGAFGKQGALGAVVDEAKQRAIIEQSAKTSQQLQTRSQNVETFQKLTGARSLSPEVQRYLQQGGEVPPEMMRVFDKARKKAPPAAPAPAPATRPQEKSGTAPSTTPGEAPPVKITSTVGFPDARIQPTMTTQSPGSPSVRSTRGVQ